MDAGYTVLKVTKDDGAYVYGSGAYDYATGNTGVGGTLRTEALANEWNSVRFINVVGVGATLPTGYTEPYSNSYMSTGTLIGGSTPNGDIRGEGTGYVSVVDSTPHTLSGGATYSGALYAIYEGTYNPYTGKVPIGIGTAAVSAGGYYEGRFVTKDIKEFATVFTVDTGDLISVTTGSGIHKQADVTLQFGLENPAGTRLSSASAISQDPFIQHQKISILDINGNLVYPDYKITTDSFFTFTKSQNEDVFGVYTKDFGIRNDVVNYNGNTQRSEIFLYANELYVDKMFYQASGGTYLNESDNTGNFSPPNTGGMSAADAADAIRYFNNQPVNNTGISGQIDIQISFENDPTYTDYGSLAVYVGTEENFNADEGSLISVNPLSHSVALQKGQTFSFFSNDRVPENTGVFFKLALNNSIQSSKKALPLGEATLEGIPQGREWQLSKFGDQTMEGCLTITECLNVGGDATGSGIGGRLTGPGGLVYLLTGDGGGGAESDTLQSVTDRGATTTTKTTFGSSLTPTSSLTVVTQSADDQGINVLDHGDPSNVIAALGGDSNAAGLLELNDTDGNASVKAESDSSNRGRLSILNAGGDEERYVAKVDSNDMGYVAVKDSDEVSKIIQEIDSSKNAILNVKDAAGTTKVKIDTNSSNKQLLVEGNTQIKTAAGKYILDTDVSSDKIVFGKLASQATSNSAYEVAYDNAVIAAYDSNIYSTGCVVVAGSGHVISGNWDSIVGGAINDISGGDFCLIGGGSGHCVTGSDYSTSVGGYNNDIYSTDAAFIGGGFNNLIESGSLVSAIAGGYSGIITDSQFGFVGGGARNHILSGSDGAVIMGGYGNQVEPASNYSVQGGGRVNKLSGQYSFNAGGFVNTLSGDSSVILAGTYNEVVADNALAAGNYSRVQAGHDGAFVLSDSSTTPALSSGANTLGLHFQDGVYVDSTSGLFVNGNAVSTSETDTLQAVTDRGSTTTTSITSTGPHISGATGLFGDSVGIGSSPNAAYDLHVQGASFATGGVIGPSFLGQAPPTNGLSVEGNLAIGYYAATNKLGVGGNASVGSSYLSVAAPSNGLIVEGNMGIGTHSPLTALDVRGNISGSGNFLGTGVGNRITNNHIPYLLSGDVTTSELGLGTAATKDVGISNTNVLQANSTITDDDFLRVDGTQIEGRSASEVLSDIGAQASLTFGIANTNAVKIDSADVADDEYARFTADGLESRSTSEVLGDIGAQASLTFGISNTNAVKIDSASVADDEYARFTSAGLESRSTSEVLSDIGALATGLTGAAASLDVGISNNNVIQANNTLVDNDFLRIDGTQVEGRSASEVLSDIGGQASLTFGISNTNAVKIDSASVADDEYARFTADGLESRSTSEVLSDIGGVADGGSPTFNSIYLQNTIFHDGDTDTRIDVSADTIQLATAGTTALTVASNSNVGLGTDSPNAAYKLHTQGLAYATGAVIGGSYAGQSPPTNGLAIEGKTAIGYYTTSNNLGIYGNASVGTSYITASAPSNGLIVQGNVGIGNNAPQTELDVSGAIKGGFNLSEKSADFTLDAGHNGTFFNGTSASFDQISISSDLGANFNCSVMHTTKDVDIVASSSMIINGTTDGTVTVASGYQPASIIRITTNSYAVFGNLL